MGLRLVVQLEQRNAQRIYLTLKSRAQLKDGVDLRAFETSQGGRCTMARRIYISENKHDDSRRPTSPMKSTTRYFIQQKPADRLTTHINTNQTRR